MKPGEPEKQDSDYARKGTCSIFIFTEPLASWRHTTVSERRTKTDWVHQVRELLDIHYPNAKKVLQVIDNLDTHTISSLYEAFPPDEARRLAKRLKIDYTPKHGSCLNIAEIELSATTRQCLRRRFASITFLEAELSAWEISRNDK